MEPMLIVFGGLPGTGKSTLARPLAQHFQAVYLRIDTIEQALRSSGAVKGDMGPTGYMVAYALAEDNLRSGRNVVADSVNPIAITRNAWRDIAERTSAELIEIETVCSDQQEHRNRVTARKADIPGLVPPTWEEVVTRSYEPWDRARLVIDTAGKTIPAAWEELLRILPILT